MMTKLLYKYLSTLLLVVGLTSSTLSPDVEKHINNGLSVATALSDTIEKANFTGVITKLATAINPYLGAIGPIVGFIMGLISHQESAELTYMKRMMTEIDNRFNRLDNRFDEVKRKIDWSSIEVKFGILEQKIIAVAKEFQKVYTVPASGMKGQAHLFVLNYESDFQNSASKLYDGIMNENGVFTKSLGDAAREYTGNDRHQVQHFLLGLLKLIMQGAKLELAYLKAKGPKYESSYAFTLTDWEHKIAKIRTKLQQIDNQVVSTFQTSATADIEKFATDNKHMSNQDFVGALYKVLDGKYYWRHWMVLAYKPLAESDHKNHKVHACGGTIKYNFAGRDIVVASVDEHKTPINLVNTNTLLTHMSVATEHQRHGGKRSASKRYLVTKPADEVFNEFPVSARTHCSPYAAAIVVGWGQDVWFHYVSSRFTMVHKDPRYTLAMFG